MKTIKGLLLGAAATLAMGSVASAADLPAAEPVEYVRICDAYGAGFFFIPGTDTCLRISGYVRVQAFVHSDNASVTNYTGFGAQLFAPAYAFAGEQIYGSSTARVAGGAPIAANNFVAGAAGNPPAVFGATTTPGAAPLFVGIPGLVGPGFTKFSSNAVDQLDMGIRALLRFDARSRTEWGVLRSFFEFAADSATNAVNGSALVVRYGFVQFGPITAGLTDSFFNFDNGSYYGDVVGDRTSRVVTFAYTAAFGNGISATIALEDATVGAGGAQAGIGGTTGSLAFNNPPTGGFNAYRANQQLPDLVGNLRIAQSWGTAQISGMIGRQNYRDDQCQFPGGVGGLTSVNPAVVQVDGTVVAGNAIGAINNGVCDWDKTAWAIKGGLRVNLDMLSRGSSVQIQGTYGVNASNYVFNGTTINVWQSTIVPGTATVDQRGLNDIESWSLFGQFQYFFTPALRGTVYGGYAKLDYQGNWGSLGGNAIALDSTWQVGGQIQWTPVRNLDLGVDVFYTQARWSAIDGTTAGPFTGAGVIARTNTDAWGAIFRVQRSF